MIFFKHELLIDVDTALLALKDMDPVLASSLSMIYKLLCDAKVLSSNNPNEIEKLNFIRNSVTDLSLTFELPGYLGVELKPGGVDEDVTLDNLEEYLQLVCDTLLGSGITDIIQSVRRGFSRVASLKYFQMFSVLELEAMINGTCALFDRSDLLNYLHYDHGYNSESAQVRYLIDVLCSFNSQEQRLFLQFLTGSPRLPIGGIRNLVPQITVVESMVGGGGRIADEFLPSASTCVSDFVLL
jgi:E3 ubiquitin-protein ligase TRIP12